MICDVQFASSTVQHIEQSINNTKELLCSGRWIYEAYILDFNGSKREQVYKRNRKSNPFNLVNNWVQFFPDGSFNEYDINGNIYKGRWRLLENETKLETYIPGSVHHNISTIKILTADRLEWNDDIHDTYGEMIHPIDTINIDPSRL